LNPGDLFRKNRDNFFSLGATVCRALSRFLLVFLASYLLTKYEFGLFTIFLSIYFFARLFAENSLNLPFIKFATDGEHDPAVVGFQIILLKIFYVGVVSAVILLGSGLIVRYTGLERRELLFYLPPMLLCLTFFIFVSQVLVYQIRMRQLFWYELVNCALFLLMTGGYLLVGPAAVDSEILLIIFSAAMACSGLVGLVVFRRYISIRAQFDSRVLWKIVHYSKYTVLSGISSLVILKADVLMLGFFRTPREVGVYGMALFVNEAVNVVFDSVLRICLPRASALSGEGNEEKIGLLFRQSVKNIYIGVAAITVVVALAAPAVLSLVYKGRYDDSLVLIYIFLAASLVKPAGYVSGVILGATGRIRLDNRICWATAALNVCCNYFFIPAWGAVGAAVASLLSFTVMTVLYVVSIRRLTRG
jgi:O-antigen/teichoic acid export membrane protein